MNHKWLYQYFLPSSFISYLREQTTVVKQGMCVKPTLVFWLERKQVPLPKRRLQRRLLLKHCRSIEVHLSV